MRAWKNNRKTFKQEDYRYRFLAAVVFLLAGSIVVRLAVLQIFQKDIYLALANNQHQGGGQLEPERGKIYFQDRNVESKNGLFAIASNKTLVTIYAIPRDLKDSASLANAVYEYIKKPLVEKEVDDQLLLEEADGLNKRLLATDSLENAERMAEADKIKKEYKVFLATPAYLEAKQAKKIIMVEDRKKAIINEYDNLLSRSNSTYKILAKRVDPMVAREFHLALINKNDLPSTLKAEDLNIVSGRMSSDKLKSVENQILDFAGIGYEEELFRFYPENNIAAHLLGYVGFEPEVKNEKAGRHGFYGLEGFFDEELFGQFGEVKSERGNGGVLITTSRNYKDKTDGDNLILTIDRSVQFYATEVIKEATRRYGADTGTVIVMEPNSGAIIAMASYPDFNPNEYDKTEKISYFNNPAIFDQYEPGSVFKAITMAAALNEQKVMPDTTFIDPGQIMIQGGTQAITNSDFTTFGAHGLTTMTGVLEKSLNTGAIWAMQTIGEKKFAEYVQSFGFGEKTGIELDGEASGNIGTLKSKKIKLIDAASSAFGQSIAVTPIQMIASYGAIANGGRLMKPFIVKEIEHADGTKTATVPISGKQIISSKTASLLTGMLIQVVEEGHSKKAQISGYYVAGKTGTGQIADNKDGGYYSNQYNHTFISFAPADNPKFVVLVKFKNPKGITFADSTAVPVNHDIMEFLLNYWKIPQNRK